jgi:transcriptional regulator with XRE-family HTH domain
MSRSTIGPLIRSRRAQARLSQMALALEAGVSTRHLGFVELGRSRPSAELVLALAACLDLPLRERNEWLLATGYAPRFAEDPLDGDALRRIRDSVQRLLDAHDPYPGVAVDHRRNVQLSNRAARQLVAHLDADILGVPTNLFRAALHPQGLAANTDDFATWSSALLRQIDAMARTDDWMAGLAEEVSSWPRIAPREQWSRPASIPDEGPVLAWQIRMNGEVISLFTVMSTLGASTDVTLSELAVEFFFPADDRSDRLLRSTDVALTANQ